MQKQTRLTSLALLLGIGWLGLGGCTRQGFDEPTGTVRGRVLLGDGPPAEGTVVNFLHNARGISASSLTDADGKFVLHSPVGGDELPVGNYSASVAVPYVPAEVVLIPAFKRLLAQKEGKEPPVAQEPPVAEKQPERPPVPVRYRNPETSGLKFDVSEGENEFTIELVMEQPRSK